MIRKKIFITLFFSCSLVLAKSGYAYPVAIATLPALIQKSDIICIGTTQSVKVEGEEQDLLANPGIFGRLTENAPSAFPATANFVVEQVIKGSLTPGRIVLPYDKTNPRIIEGPYFTPLIPGERTILFLTQKLGSGVPVLEMTEAYTIPGPKIVIGNTSIPNITGLTAYRAVLSCLIAGLSNKEAAVRLTCLVRLRDEDNIGMLLYPQRSSYFATQTAQTRQELGEPPGMLEAFVEQNIVPAVLYATSDSDEQVRQNAVWDAAVFQRMESLPELVQMIATGKSMSFPITFYRKADAAPFLLPLLSADDPLTRGDTADTLARMKALIALPVLLAQMNRSYPEVKRSDDARYSIISALYAITGVSMPKDFFKKSDGQWDFSPEKAQQYILFWNAWSKQHQAELDKLQHEIDQFQKLQKRTPSRLSLQSRSGKAA